MRSSRIFALVAAWVVAACDTTEPEEIGLQDVMRPYAAVVFRTVLGGVSTDHLARGASLTLTLNADRSTTGRLFVPEGAEGGGDLDLSLAGTFSFDDTADEITLAHAADTFLRDVTFLAARVDGQVTLSAEASFGSTTVTAVLR